MKVNLGLPKQAFGMKAVPRFGKWLAPPPFCKPGPTSPVLIDDRFDPDYPCLLDQAPTYREPVHVLRDVEESISIRGKRQLDPAYIAECNYAIHHTMGELPEEARQTLLQTGLNFCLVETGEEALSGESLVDSMKMSIKPFRRWLREKYYQDKASYPFCQSDTNRLIHPDDLSDAALLNSSTFRQWHFEAIVTPKYHSQGPFYFHDLHRVVLPQQKTSLLPLAVKSGWNHIIRHEVWHHINRLPGILLGTDEVFAEYPDFRRLILNDMQIAQQNGKLPPPKAGTATGTKLGNYFPYHFEQPNPNIGRWFDEALVEIGASLDGSGGACPPNFVHSVFTSSRRWVHDNVWRPLCEGEFLPKRSRRLSV